MFEISIKVNSFARLIKLSEFQFERVKYYSIQFEVNDVCEFYDFLNRIEDIPEIEDDLDNLIIWIDEIGEKYGATTPFFRNESETADLRALPPPHRMMKIHEIEVNDLRLYCMVLNESVVILLNGGIKTRQKAQDCPNVSPYFKQGNKIAKIIDSLFKSGEIEWNENHTDIFFDHNLEIEL